MLKEGDKAPEFILNDSDGNKISLKDFRGKKIVLYFYPKDNTPGCTKQACAFKDSFEKFKNVNTEVLGVSADSESSHQKFINKFELPFTLLSDPEKEVIQKYGAWQEKSMYGKKYMGIVRSTYIIDEHGIIQKVYPKVNVAGHIDDVYKFIKDNS